MIQTAAAHAADGSAAPPDLRRDYAAARMDDPWLLDVPGGAWREDALLHLTDLPRLCARLRDDINLMARPLEGSPDPDHKALLDRTATWGDWLAARDATGLSDHALALLTGGKRGGEDTFHILVMDLHKALNRLAADVASDEIDGAHVWQLEAADTARVAAFMRGLNRTRHIKFDHPGLETAATRDGARLLIQNDIGTNDAHVLVIQVEDHRITLTYSDLHDRRFAFFQGLLEDIGASWSGVGARNTAGLNAGADYILGTAQFDCADDAALLAALEGLGARIVFLIDWKRARKRLNLLVRKSTSVEVLTEAARREVGHMGWLLAGGDRVVFAAMEALGPDYFRMGDQLDAVMGADQAREFLVEALSLATAGLRAKQAAAQIEDQTRDGKRTPTAAARIALDMADEGLIAVETARLRTAGLTAADLTTKGLVAEDGTPLIPLAQAATAASGVVSGEIAFDEARVRDRKAAGASVVLVRRDAETRDISALDLADGLLTQHGARTSHAAVVARQLGKVCLVGCEAMQVDETQRALVLAGTRFQEGDVITLDGNSGLIYAGALRHLAQPRPAMSYFCKT